MNDLEQTTERILGACDPKNSFSAGEKKKKGQSLWKGQGICSRNTAVQVGKITSSVQFEVKEFHFKGQSMVTFMINFGDLSEGHQNKF